MCCNSEWKESDDQAERLQNSVGFPGFMDLLMSQQIWSCVKFFATNQTAKRLPPFDVRHATSFEMIAVGNHIATRLAKIGLFPCVCPQVNIEIWALSKGLPTERTLVWLFTCVDSQMHSQVVPASKLPVTFGAFEGPLSLVNLIHVSDQIRVPVKQLATESASLHVPLGSFLLRGRGVTVARTTRRWAVAPIAFISIIQCYSYSAESWQQLGVCLRSCLWFSKSDFHILRRFTLQAWNNTESRLLLLDLLRVTGLIFLHNGKLVWLLWGQNLLRDWLGV